MDRKKIILCSGYATKHRIGVAPSLPIQAFKKTALIQYKLQQINPSPALRYPQKFSVLSFSVVVKKYDNGFG